MASWPGKGKIALVTAQLQPAPPDIQQLELLVKVPPKHHLRPADQGLAHDHREVRPRHGDVLPHDSVVHSRLLSK